MPEPEDNIEQEPDLDLSQLSASELTNLRQHVGPEGLALFDRLVAEKRDSERVAELERKANLYDQDIQQREINEAYAGLEGVVALDKFLEENGNLPHENQVSLLKQLKQGFAAAGVTAQAQADAAAQDAAAAAVAEVENTMGVINQVLPGAASGAPEAKTEAQKQQEQKQEALAGGETSADQFFADQVMGALGQPQKQTSPPVVAGVPTQ